ncbi:putative DNA helicase [Helianthus annuus]|nr:putative DNA helicase [Helianthus annuus]
MENAENNVDSTNSKFVEFWVPVPISNVQLEQYCATLLSNDAALRTNSKSDTLGALNDIFVTIRKCCNHPYTVDLKVEQSLIKDKDPSMAVDVGVEASGKLRFLDRVLPEIQKQQRKVLILFQDVVEDFLYILSHKCKSNDTTSKSIITRVQNTLLHAEVKTHLPDGDQPYILEGQCPAWKFVSQSTPQRQRKRPHYLLEGESDVDGSGVKTCRKIVNNEPAQLKTVTGGVNEGVSAATNKSQSLSGDQFSLTSMLDHLKPTVSELCNILKFSEDVKIIVDRFLEYVLENFIVGKEHTSLLQALMISLCWIGSSLAKNKIDRSESFALAKKHFEFSCTEEETESVYNKLKLVKDKYLNHGLPHVESAEVAKPAVKEENAEDSIILPAASHANEDHNVSFCSDSGNPVSAAISQDKTPSVHKQRLKADCEKEIDEVVAQIRLKYEAKHQEADAAYNSKKMELVTNIHRVPMNKGLADAFRSKCQDLTPSVHPGIFTFKKKDSYIVFVSSILTKYDFYYLQYLRLLQPHLPLAGRHRHLALT